jgi:hypothetical protein
VPGTLTRLGHRGGGRRLQTAPAAARPQGRRTGFSEEFRDGVRASAGNRELVAVCSATAVAMVGVGVLNALDVFFVSDNLHAQAKWLGFLGAAFGLGRSWARSWARC